MARGLTKRYGNTTVLKNVDLTVEGGRVHAIVGENGAGKSTFVKIVAGIVPHGSYDGTVELDGEELAFSSAHAGSEAGVVMVPQELHVVAHLSIAENMFASRLPGRRGIYDSRAAVRAARESLEIFGLDVDPRKPAASLSPAQRRLMVLAAALHGSARVLILDEPTASLTEAETAVLLDQLQVCVRSGAGIIYITHRLDELDRIADEVTVFRNGAAVSRHDTVPPTSVVVRDMLGETLEAITELAHAPTATVQGREPVLEVRGLSVYGADKAKTMRVRDASFEVYPGEIVGLYGLVGAGRTELAQALYGAWPGTVTGHCSVGGVEGLAKTTEQASRRGLALLVEDRKSQGVLPGQTVLANMTASMLDDFSALRFLIDKRAERRRVGTFITDLDVRPARADVAIDSLSGGNQQKVLIARCLRRGVKVLILDEPTVGVDVGARRDIYELIRTVARDLPVGVLLISSDVDEVCTEANRILVMYKGQIRGEFPHSGPTHSLLAAATGA